MPERSIEDFTAAAGIEGGDLWHIQRHADGVWTDHQVKNKFMFGQDFATKRVVYPIQDILGAAQPFAGNAVFGNIWLPTKTFAIYTPGTINDGLTVLLRGELGYAAGNGYQVDARFVFNSTTQGSTLRPSEGWLSVGSNATWTFSFGADATGTTSNGTITVFAAYVAVPV